MSVISLHGTPVAGAEAEPDPELVEFVESLLERARSGRIVGLVYGTVDRAAHISYGYAGNADRHSMLSAASLLWAQVVEAARQ